MKYGLGLGNRRHQMLMKLRAQENCRQAKRRRLRYF